MKLSVRFFIAVTTLLLIAVAVMVHYRFSFTTVFATVMIGQAWWILTVYKVLSDDYHTDKTFEQWYEDRPLEKD